MTTIAYKDGVLAADSACVCDGVYEGRVEKVVRSNALNAYIAVSGNLANQAIFQRWLESGARESEKPELDDFSAMVVRGDGAVTQYDKLLEEFRIYGEFFAIGSGRELAVGAMAAGATAVEAVEVACRFDTSSHGPVDVFDVASPGAAAV